MMFVLQIWLLPKNEDGWTSCVHWPLLHIYAPTRKDAEQRVADIMKTIPWPGSFDLVEVSNG